MQKKDLKTMQEYAALVAEKRRLEAELRTVGKNAAAHEERVLRIMSGQLQNVKLEGGPTLYLKRQLWVKAPKKLDDSGNEILNSNGTAQRDTFAACEALKAAGLGEFVKEGYNAQTVSAYFRELDNEGVDPPKEVADVMDFDVTPRVGVRKS